jgi:hypothetical protein
MCLERTTGSTTGFIFYFPAESLCPSRNRLTLDLSKLSVNRTTWVCTWNAQQDQKQDLFASQIPLPIQEQAHAWSKQIISQQKDLGMCLERTTGSTMGFISQPNPFAHPGTGSRLV